MEDFLIQLSIIIVDYFSAEETISYIENLGTQKIDNYNICVVDNSCNERNYRLLKSLSNYKNIYLLKTSNNLGYGRGINYALKHLRIIQEIGKYVLVTNQDLTFTDSNSINTLLVNLEHNNYDGISCIIKNNNDILHHYYFKRNFWYVLFHFRFQNFKKNHIPANVFGFSGAFFIIKESLMRRVRDFPDEIFLYFEEDILFCKLSKLGCSFIINKDISIIHNESQTVNRFLSSYNKKKIVYKSEKIYLFYYLNINFFLKIIFVIERNIELLLAYLYEKIKSK